MSVKHVLPVQEEGTKGPMVVEVAGRTVEGAMAGQVGVDDDLSKLPRHHSQKVGVASGALSPSENPMGQWPLSSWAPEA